MIVGVILHDNRPNISQIPLVDIIVIGWYHDAERKLLVAADLILMFVVVVLFHHFVSDDFFIVLLNYFSPFDGVHSLVIVD